MVQGWNAMTRITEIRGDLKTAHGRAGLFHQRHCQNSRLHRARRAPCFIDTRCSDLQAESSGWLFNLVWVIEENLAGVFFATRGINCFRPIALKLCEPVERVSVLKFLVFSF